MMEFQMNEIVQERYNAADVVLLPKGENREPVMSILQESGWRLPSFPGRRLHPGGK